MRASFATYNDGRQLKDGYVEHINHVSKGKKNRFLNTTTHELMKVLHWKSVHHILKLMPGLKMITSHDKINLFVSNAVPKYHPN